MKDALCPRKFIIIFHIFPAISISLVFLFHDGQDAGIMERVVAGSPGNHGRSGFFINVEKM